MEKGNLQRLIKIEDRIKQILFDDMKLKSVDVEFDVIPPQRMLEIMAYRLPTNISNWKYGRDYEKNKTLYDLYGDSLPYEVVIHDNPARAYLMDSNTLAVQALVIAHVYGHTNFFTESKWFINNRNDIMSVMREGSKRFNEYERMYGIGEVEKIVDAAHSIQFHSSPFDNETEEEKRLRVFDQMKEKRKITNLSSFGDLTDTHKSVDAFVDDASIDLMNNRLWRELKQQIPVEPTEDLLRFIIDNSRILEDWQKDILEILRIEGQYYWPIMRSRYMNEGWATFIHQKIMNKLFDEELLTAEEHGQYNYSNSLVKAMSRYSMNPYLIGSGMWEHIEERWDKGRHGKEYMECSDYKLKEEWDTKEMGGFEKCKDVMRTYTDWFFMQDFLTEDVIDKLDMYIYTEVPSADYANTVDYVRTDHTAAQIRELIVNSFSNSGIPKINIIDGNHHFDGSLYLSHDFSGIELDKLNTVKTLEHIYTLWGRPVVLSTTIGDKRYEVKIDTNPTIRPPKKS